MLRKSLVALLLVAPAVSSAQNAYANFAPALAMSNLTMQPLIHQSNLARAQARRQAGVALPGTRQEQGGRAAAAGPANLSPSALAYQPSSALAQTTVTEFIERLRSRDRPAAEAMSAQFTRHDYGKIYKGIVAPFGLRDDNAADVLTAYTVLGWMVATGAGDPGRDAVAATRRQIGARMAANPTLSSPANRARVGEELKLLFVTLHVGWQAARREGNLKQYSDGVAAMFKQQGTDLRALRLTSDGLGAA